MATSYSPGDWVPADGIYEVHHDQHRLIHEATLTEGIRFPICRKCGTQARFTLKREVVGGVIPFRSNLFLQEYPSTAGDYLEAV